MGELPHVVSMFLGSKQCRGTLFVAYIYCIGSKKPYCMYTVSKYPDAGETQMSSCFFNGQTFITSQLSNNMTMAEVVSVAMQRAVCEVVLVLAWQRSY